MLQHVTSISWVSYYSLCNARIDMFFDRDVTFHRCIPPHCNIWCQFHGSHVINYVTLELTRFYREVAFLRSNLTTHLILLYDIINLTIHFKSFDKFNISFITLFIPYASINECLRDFYRSEKASCGTTIARTGPQAISKADHAVVSRRE